MRGKVKGGGGKGSSSSNSGDGAMALTGCVAKTAPKSRFRRRVVYCGTVRKYWRTARGEDCWVNSNGYELTKVLHTQLQTLFDTRTYCMYTVITVCMFIHTTKKIGDPHSESFDETRKRVELRLSYE
jgi:hypothetical protein